jgi:dihydrolipoamide dehydrogenase
VHALIIGAYGSAGVSAAEELADAADVDQLTLVDDGVPGGGLCILQGCMPSKEVISAAGHRYQARHDPRLRGDPASIDLEAVVSIKDDHTGSFASHRRKAVHDLAERESVAFVHGSARFLDDETVRIDATQGPDRDLEPDYVVIATGSTVDVPDLDGIEDVEYSTSADVLDATEVPDSGIVMGFGYVGLELVPYLSEAGVDLTVIEHDDRPLDEADPAYGDEILDQYREEFGVEILTRRRERRVESTDGGVRLHVDGPDGAETVEAEALFLFTGRRPNLDGLGLETTSMTPDSGDGEWVADTMQARDHERVFVVGDANGKEPILHVAKEHGGLGAQNVCRHARGEPLERYENVHHHVVFSGAGVYPYARVGHSAASAADLDREVVTVTRRASDDGVFKTKQVPRGLATLVADAADGTVLGYQGLHYHADAMAKTMQVAVEMGLDVRELPDRAYHPTTPEIIDGLLREASDQLA